MLNTLTYRQKNKFLSIIAAFFALLAYQFAFTRTIESFILNKELKQQVSGKDPLSTGIFNKDTNQRLNIIIDKYTADSSEWENDFWFTVSGIAAKRSIAVIYGRGKESESDSLNIMRKQVQFSGNYSGLIQLLDSLERDTKAGFLAGVELKVSEPKSAEKSSIIVAKSEFRVIADKD